MSNMIYSFCENGFVKIKYMLRREIVGIMQAMRFIVFNEPSLNNIEIM